MEGAGHYCFLCLWATGTVYLLTEGFSFRVPRSGQRGLMSRNCIVSSLYAGEALLGLRPGETYIIANEDKIGS